MRKHKSFVFLLISAFLLCSCSPKTKVEEAPKVWERYKTPRVIIPEDEAVYTNEEAGYRIVFPEYWQGNYVITEYSPDEICIGFYGESKTGQIRYKGKTYYSERDGLDMGWIVSTSKVMDEDIEIGKIGEAKDVEYLLLPPRGGPQVGELDLIADPNYLSRKVVSYPVDETELALAAQDWEKAVPMRDDIYNMNIKFEAIE